MLQNCDDFIFDFLFNSRIFKANFFNGIYLIDLLTTKYGIKHIINYLKNNGFNGIKFSIQNNLFLLSFQNDNIDLFEFLLQNIYVNRHIIEIKDILNNTILHYLAMNNSINCGYLFLNYLEQFHKDELYKYLTAKNDSGDTAFHSCCLGNKKDFLLILLEFVKRNSLIVKFEKNNNDLYPIQIALIKKNYECAKLIYEYFGLNEEQTLQIKDEYKIDIINNFKEMKNFKNRLDIKKYSEELSKNEIRQEILNINLNKISEKNNYEKFIDRISIYYELKNINKNIYLKYESIFGNPLFLNKLYNLAENGLGEIVDFFFNVIYLKIDMNKAFNKIVKFYVGFIFVNCEYSDFPSVLNNLEYILFSYMKNLDQNHPIFNWIQSIIISYYQYNDEIDTYYIISLIKDFVDIIYKLNLIDIISFTYHSDITYRFIHNLILILKTMDEKIAYIQVKWLNMIPPLLQNEIRKLTSKFKIINIFSFSDDPIYEFCSNVLKDKNSSPSYIDIAIEFTMKIEQSKIMNYKSKEKIINKINYFKNDIIDTDLNYFFDYFEKIISLIDNNMFLKKVIPIFKDKNITYKKFLDIIKHLSKIKGIDEFMEKLEDLKKQNYAKFHLSNKSNILYGSEEISEIIENFKNVDIFNNDKIYSLSDSDLDDLNEFGKLLQTAKYYSKNQLKSVGKKLGQEFRNSPNLENLANLISVIISGMIEIMNVKPYLIQTLAVASFCLYFIKDNLRNTLRGRIAQIATGEGKTLIIVMLALITSLQGYFTDIITSNTYLAKYAQNKYKPIYDAFGITSSCIIFELKNDEDFNAMIIYGKNTDFEFSIMVDEITLVNRMKTVRLGKKEKEKRNPEIAIVDEVDNLFIDTNLNGARISYPSKFDYSWVYKPIFDFISKNKKDDINVTNLRNYLKNYNKNEYSEKLEKINDELLINWITQCKKSIELERDVDYVVKYDPKEFEKSVLILDKATGRISFGMRWSKGLHEFIEVKENLNPKKESSTIGYMSHYKFYNNYKIIFGLTGTIGTENERSELKILYNLDTYDVPTNFKNKREMSELIIVNNNKEKFEKIKNDIIKYSSQKRPVLVILSNIKETLKFSDILNKENIYHKLLNDIQTENEDSIIHYGGKPGSVIIATIAAGRGTDIILNSESIKNGGLHVIFGFLPINKRIESQGIGRAGRQGQPGSSQMIVSREEKLVKLFINQKQLFNNDENEAIKMARNFANNELTNERIKYSKKAQIIDEVKTLFYESLKQLNDILNDKKYFESNDIESFSFSIGRFLLIELFKYEWSTFYGEFLEMDISLIPAKEIFSKFLVQYKWGFIKSQNLKEFKKLYKEKLESKD